MCFLHVYHDKWCKYMCSELSGRVKTIILDMERFVKSYIITLNWPGVLQGGRRVNSSPLVLSRYSSFLRNGR